MISEFCKHVYNHGRSLIMKKYKVIVWGLGSVGRYAVIMIQSKKSLELVCA
ncbi:hypothetical protein CLOSCI_03080 [[Clostridium] scindens ATCC 35704]|nr:hypothetical protein CLOSCI_03080 [[Clostridium] scindens ATCC 35704]